jgi:hypothetical protein
VNNRQAATVLSEISPARIFARPTAEDLWLGPTRESVLSHLVGPAKTRVVLGPTSSGRSSLLRCIAQREAGCATILRAAGRRTGAPGVLRSLLRSTGLDTEGLTADLMRRLISVYINERLGKGQRVLIELDDADEFNKTAWQEVEFLADLSAAGQSPELLLCMVHLDDASSPAAVYVRSQEAPVLGVVAWLKPGEVSGYLRWRFDRFDLAGINSPAATQLIAKCSKGCFAAIDHICQMALLLLRSEGGVQINVNIVREAMRRLKHQNQAKGVRETEPGAAETAPAKLIVSQDGEVIRETLLGDRLLIGRSNLNDLCLENAYLSRHHAVIVRTNKGYQLSDLNSVNGMTLNGQPVCSTPVGDGDVFCIGPFRIKLRVSEPLSAGNNDDIIPSALADTAIMPAAHGLLPAHLRVIK